MLSYHLIWHNQYLNNRNLDFNLIPVFPMLNCYPGNLGGKIIGALYTRTAHKVS